MALKRQATASWQPLSSVSHYHTAVAVEKALKRGDTVQATAGIQELKDALARSEKRALRSQPTRLMCHIIKWKTQAANRSRSWRASIIKARAEITEIQEETPNLGREVIEEMWARCFTMAKSDAEADMEEKTKVVKWTWADVFEKQYDIKD